MKAIYLDYSSTTPVSKEVLREMEPYFSEKYGNPSSIYSLGQESLFALDQSRQRIANFLECQTEEIFFTGSATEANNIVVFNSKNHAITSKIEHDAVLEPLKQKDVEVDYLPVNKDGLIMVESVKEKIKPETSLISLIYANNEIGVIQPIKEIGEMIKQENLKRENKILFHTDAVQAVNYLDCRPDFLNVDLMSLSGHKIYGPKGVGVLYVRKGVKLNPIVFGGGQERQLRSGTENVAGIVGIGKAVSLINYQDEKIKELRDFLLQEILKKIKDVQVNGSLEKRLPNNLNLSFKGAEGESLVMSLDQENIFVSTGSACSSKKLAPSHVLLALGLSSEQAHCSLRLTLGKETTKQEIERVIEVLPGIVDKLRRISGR